MAKEAVRQALRYDEDAVRNSIACSLLLLAMAWEQVDGLGHFSVDNGLSFQHGKQRRSWAIL
jgi:hypothetical protein